MTLSSTASRMLATLPIYYFENQTVERILQAWADEIDRIDDLLDTLKDGLVPVLATDDLNLLAAWEAILRLPVAPSGVTVAQRQAAVKTAFLRFDASTGAAVLELIGSQGILFSIDRDTPGALQDTLHIGYAQGAFVATVIEMVAQAAWPAHRELLTRFDAGFTLDLSRLDQDEM